MLSHHLGVPWTRMILQLAFVSRNGHRVPGIVSMMLPCLSLTSDCAVKTGEAGRINMPRRLRAALEAHRAAGGERYPYLVTV